MRFREGYTLRVQIPTDRVSLSNSAISVLSRRQERWFFHFVS
jgi:hypothetical protein